MALKLAREKVKLDLYHQGFQNNKTYQARNRMKIMNTERPKKYHEINKIRASQRLNDKK